MKNTKGTISVDIKTENDLYFAITNTILALDKIEFTEDDVVSELKKNNITEQTVHVTKERFLKYIRVCIQNLIEHKKVIEEPRFYMLKEKITEDAAL